MEKRFVYLDLILAYDNKSLARLIGKFGHMADDEITLRVLVVADNPLARVGLASLLQDQSNCEVVGQLGDDGKLADSIEVYRPDIVLWDMAWKAVEDIPSLTDVLDLAVPLVMMLNDDTQAGDLWQAGVRGLLLQDTNTERISSAIRAVAQGLIVVDQGLERVFSSGIDSSIEPLSEALTARELEVLQLLAEGLSNKAIAYTLSISDHTVKFHVTSIMTKLSAQSRTEAVVRATRLGLIHL